MTLAILSKA